MQAQEGYRIEVGCEHTLKRPLNAESAFTKGVLSFNSSESDGLSSVTHNAYELILHQPPLRHQLQPCSNTSWCRTKCLIRPQAVKAMWVHHIFLGGGLVEGWNDAIRISFDVAVLKHLRCALGTKWFEASALDILKP